MNRIITVHTKGGMHVDEEIFTHEMEFIYDRSVSGCALYIKDSEGNHHAYAAGYWLHFDVKVKE